MKGGQDLIPFLRVRINRAEIIGQSSAFLLRMKKIGAFPCVSTIGFEKVNVYWAEAATGGVL